MILITDTAQEPKLAATCGRYESVSEYLAHNPRAPDATEWCEKSTRDLFYQFYSVGAQIGKGGFGTIFSGIRRSDNRPIAVKIIKKSQNFALAY